MALYKREKYLKKIRGFYQAADIIKVITGVRRCGKSSLMMTIAEELTDNGIPSENIIYIDLEQKEYLKVHSADRLEQLIDKKSTATGMKYLFIDEVQNIKGFEELINAYRASGDYSIFITGSNSYLLSGEIMTKLTGRYIEFELFTLSFDEYIGMKTFFGKSINPNLLIELNSFITEGGFPRSILLDDNTDKMTYSESVISEIFEKDIRRRVKIKDRDSFDTVRKFIINNFGATTSINSLHNALRQHGHLISSATVTKYIQILLDAKIIYECSRFDMKSKKSLSGDKKFYIADLSFYFSQNTDNHINYGPVLENIVYFYAKSHGYAISVGRIGKLEFDIILRDYNSEYTYIQVAYTILQSSDTEDREYRSLEAIHDNYPKYVMTTDYLIQHRSGIRHVNLMEFMTHNERF
ncbi:MAG: ATP-binding protein [Spirochaetales bacterium]|nr:ATP-binding protein [Spirochaetales bacterium]